MSQRNSATPRVHLLAGQAKSLPAVNSHASESLVDLNDVDVVEGDVVDGEEFGDGDGGADAHDAGGETGGGGGDVFAEDGLAELLGGGALHEEEGGGAVGELGGVAAGSSWAPLGEGAADLRETLVGSSATNALVLGKRDLLESTILTLHLGRNRHNLIIELARILSALGLAERISSVAIHLLARDGEVARDVLGGPAHGLDAVLGLLGEGEHGGVEGVGDGVAADGHLLGAHGDADGDGAVGDGVGDVGGGFEAGGAEAVEGVGGGGVGEAGG